MAALMASGIRRKKTHSALPNIDSIERRNSNICLQHRLVNLAAMLILIPHLGFARARCLSNPQAQRGRCTDCCFERCRRVLRRTKRPRSTIGGLLVHTKLLGAVAALALGLAAAPAIAASDSATASVTILRPVTVTKTTDLAFGRVVQPSSGSGTVSISKTDGSRSFTGGVTLLTSTTGKASFTVAGEGAQAVTVSVPGSFSIANTSGPGTLTVTTDATNTGSQTLSGSLGGAGSLTVDVGGTITVTNTTNSGAYSGTFLVSADYQ